MHAHGDALFGAAMGREGSTRARGGAFQHAVADLRGHQQAHEAGGGGGGFRESSAHGGNHHGGSSIAKALDRQASLSAALSAATANGPRPRGACCGVQTR